VFPRFTTVEPGFGKKKGESVTITRMRRLPLATRVSETERLPRGRPVLETKQVTISEWGHALPVTDFERNLSHFDLMNPFQTSLRNQIKLTMDVMVAQTFKLTPIKYVPEASGFTLTTDGTAGATADRNLSVDDLREIHDYMSGTLKIPPYANGKYVGILSTKAARGLKNDPDFKDWQAPHTSTPFMTGELPAAIENFTLIESNNYGYEQDALDNSIGSGNVLGEAVFFGADAVGMLEVMAPELRMGLTEDLGRFQDIGWVGVFEAFHTWEAADLARVVHVTSL
jgi:N4-gp56 family major capsid protein